MQSLRKVLALSIAPLALALTAPAQFVFIVAATAPRITTAPTLPGGTISTAYSQTLAASGGTTPYAWALVAGTLPGGVTLNSAGVISGTPTNYGMFNFTVGLTDYAGLTTTKAFSISIPVPPLVITGVSPMVNGQQGNPYSQALTAVGGVTPYSWSIAGGSLPPGLALDSLGDITGTPTNLGTFNFTARVTDSVTNTATKGLAITITSPTLMITTEELPDSVYGATYAQTLTASGGTTPYTWSLLWGALPDGLSLGGTGLVSGTPHQWGHVQLHRASRRPCGRDRRRDVHGGDSEQRAHYPRAKLH
jgi:large repetitive protein